LDDLENGNVALPPDADAAGGLKVVPVHDNVDHEVERDWNPRNSGVTNELGVAEQSCGAMMIGVQESCWLAALLQMDVLTEWLLFQKQENSVKQFQILGQVVELFVSNTPQPLINIHNIV
jgi:hypothetical protein